MAIKRNCKDCNVEFFISTGEYAFYEKRELSLPVRCIPHRRAASIARQQRMALVKQAETKKVNINSELRSIHQRLQEIDATREALRSGAMKVVEYWEARG